MRLTYFIRRPGAADMLHRSLFLLVSHQNRGEIDDIQMRCNRDRVVSLAADCHPPSAIALHVNAELCVSMPAEWLRTGVTSQKRSVLHRVRVDLPHLNVYAVSP